MYDIPGFSKYYIGSDFKIYNKQHNNMLSGSLTDMGYVSITLINDEGVSKTHGEHYFIAITLIPKPDLVINHKDNNKANNNPSNLEWCTNSENRFHAFKQGTIQTNQFVQVKDNVRNEILFFNSIHQCSKHFKLDRTSIKGRLLKGPEKVYPGGFQFRSPASTEPFPEVKDIDKALLEYGTYKPVLIKNLETGVISRFDRLIEAGSFIGVKPATLTGHFKRSQQPVIRDIFQLKMELDDSGWLKPVNIKVDQPVVVFDSLTNSSITYPTAIEAANSNGLKATALMYRLDLDTDKLWSDGKSYKRVKKL